LGVPLQDLPGYVIGWFLPMLPTHVLFVYHQQCAYLSKW
jgi:hypothetical protein